jgi:hypothetical protein
LYVAQTEPAIAAKICLSAVDRAATRTLDRQFDAAHITEVSLRKVLVAAGRYGTVWSTTVVILHDPAPVLPRLHEKARSPILAPALFGLFGTLGPLFSVTEDGNAALMNAPRHEIVHRGFGPTFAEIHVELILSVRGAPIVTVTFDEYDMGWMVAQPCRVRVENIYVARSDHCAAEVKIDVL